jgi:group I intron endonuclease
MLPYSTPPEGGGLYVIRLSEKHYYGGRAVCFATRWDNHLRALQAGKHDNTHMQRVFNKYGGFSPEVVRVLDRGAQPDAEQAWLDEHHGKPGCVNLSAHARGGCSGHTEDTRNKMRNTRSSRPDLVEKARESLSRNRLPAGTPRSPEHAEAIAMQLRGRKQDPEVVEKRAASNRGRKNTPETLARMSESAKRRAQAQPTSHGGATRSLISTQQRGRVWVNDGQANQRLFPEEADRLLACGWRKGIVRA